jgi:hypothetical protein
VGVTGATHGGGRTFAEEDPLHLRGEADTDVQAHFLHQDAAVALWSWREEHVGESESETPAEGTAGPDDEGLVDRARNLNELRFEGLINDRELAAERDEIRRGVGLPEDSGESSPGRPPR